MIEIKLRRIEILYFDLLENVCNRPGIRVVQDHNTYVHTPRDIDYIPVVEAIHGQGPLLGQWTSRLHGPKWGKYRRL